MKDIHESILELSDYLKSQEDLKKLKKIESKMEANEEVISLSNDFLLAQREYSDSLKHYDESSIEVKKYYHLMYQAKLKLDSHPIVKEYYQLFQLVNEPLHYLELNLINKFKKSGDCK